MARSASDLSARGYVYALVWQRAPGERFTCGEIKREAIKLFGGSRDRKVLRVLERLMAPSAIERPLAILHSARIVKREGRSPMNGAVMWVRERLPKVFSSDLLVMRGGGRRAVTKLLDALVLDRQVELREDGLYHDTREAS